MTSEVLTLSEAAEILKVRPGTMRLYARTGIVPATKLGKSWRFRATDLKVDDWLDLSGAFNDGYKINFWATWWHDFKELLEQLSKEYGE